MLILKKNKNLNRWISNESYFTFHSIEKCLNYYFNFTENVKLEDNNNYNAIMHSIQDDNLNNYEENKINIMVCIENCKKWKHYKHFNKFKNYGNPKIQIYFYNHIDKIVLNEKYIAIPFIYTRINHFNLYKNIIKPTKITPFKEKKFCLFTSRFDYMKISNILRKFGKCDHIKNFKKRIGDKSLYFSDELLNFMNEYKFIFCSENSFCNGYITEKIFNCFFCKSIPIYLGPNDTLRYFNNNCFLNVRNKKELINKIKKYINNEDLYKNIINCKKINENYYDENYISLVTKFIKKNLIK